MRVCMCVSCMYLYTSVPAFIRKPHCSVSQSESDDTLTVFRNVSTLCSSDGRILTTDDVGVGSAQGHWANLLAKHAAHTSNRFCTKLYFTGPKPLHILLL